MSAKVELCFFDLLSDSAISEDALRIAFKNIVASISPIKINCRFEVDYFSRHLYSLSLILANPNAGEKLKTDCFREMVSLHRRLLSIHQQIREIENEVLRFESFTPKMKRLVKGEVRTNSSRNWRQHRTEISRMKLKKECVGNFKRAFADSDACLNISESKLPDTPEAQLLKLLR